MFFCCESSPFYPGHSIAWRDKHFSFYRLPASWPAYSVAVQSECGGQFIFSMIREAGGHGRAAAHRLPLWVAQAESALATALQAQELFV